MRSLGAGKPRLRTLLTRVYAGRWALFLLAGSLLLSIGLAHLLIVIYRPQPLFAPPFAYASLMASLGVRALVLSATGAVLVLVAFHRLKRLSHTTAQPARPTEGAMAWSFRPVGPRIVALGGGHGLSTLLRGLKNHTDQLTAVVTVADDGGSSGILRRELGILPPGDVRNCIAALADAEPLMTELLQYRFGRGTGLDGHAFGNLFIAAMADVTGGFETGISEASRVLAVRGRVIPSSLENVSLCAEVHRPETPDEAPFLVQGQSQIAKARGVVERVYLQPDHVHGYPEAIRALLRADLIVLGPGSLYTSVLPNLLVNDIREAIKASGALKVYICNVATQPGETDGYSVGDHLRALRSHTGPGLCDYVLANSNTAFALPEASGSTMVLPEFEGIDGCQLVLEDLVDRQLPWRHDANRLAAALLRLFNHVQPNAPTEELWDR